MLSPIISLEFFKCALLISLVRSSNFMCFFANASTDGNFHFEALIIFFMTSAIFAASASVYESCSKLLAIPHITSMGSFVSSCSFKDYFILSTSSVIFSDCLISATTQSSRVILTF